MFTIQDGRDSFYQWDIDRKLIVEDKAISEVHFCNKTDDCSLVCPTYEEDGVTVVNVPNILLQTDWKIRVYAYDKNYTKFSATFGVIARTKPESYIYTETEVNSWRKLEDRMSALEGTVSAEGIADAVQSYLEENPVEAGATVEEAEQIQRNKEDITELQENDKDLLEQIQNIQLTPGEKGEDGAPGLDGFWWRGIPDNIIIQYNADGTVKDGSTITFYGYLMRGNTPFYYTNCSGNIGGSFFNYQLVESGLITVNITPFATYEEAKDITKVNVSIIGGLNIEYIKDITITYLVDATGTPGEKGADGEPGAKGDKGDPGEQGIQGEKGDTGADGYTPIKGTDYFTDADKEELVADVLAALPIAEGVAV